MPVMGSLRYGRGRPLATGTGWTGVCWGYLRSCALLLWGQFVPTAITLVCHTSSPASPCLSFPKQRLQEVPVQGPCAGGRRQVWTEDARCPAQPRPRAAAAPESIWETGFRTGEPGQPLWSTPISYTLLQRSVRRCCKHWVSSFPGDKQHLPDFASFSLEKPRNALSRRAPALPHLERGCREVSVLMR